MARTPEQPLSTAAADPAGDRLLLALADHLHEHCTCELLDGERCDACEVRGGLSSARDDLLAWRAQGRRLAQRRDEMIANARAQVQRRRASCGGCAGLAGLATSTGREE